MELISLGDYRRFYMIQNYLKKLYVFFICMLAFNIYSSEHPVDSRNDVFKSFLEYVNEYAESVDVCDDLPSECKFLDSLPKDMVSPIDGRPAVIYMWLLKYAFYQLRLSYGSDAQSFDSKFRAEVARKEAVRKACRENNLAFLKKEDKEYIRQGGKLDDSPDVKSFRKYRNMTVLGNLYGDYKRMYDSLNAQGIITDPVDFILCLKFMNQDKFDREELFSLDSDKVSFCINRIKEVFPVATHQFVVAAREEKKRALEELAREQELKRKKGLEIEQEKRRKIKLANDLKQSSDFRLLKNNFGLWSQAAQNELHKRRSYLAECFFSFVQAIEYKVKLRKELFNQQVIMPNTEHANLVQNISEGRTNLFEEKGLDIIRGKEEQFDEVVRFNEQIKQERDTVRFAKTARREKILLMKDVIKDKSNRYASDLITFVQENNISAAGFDDVRVELDSSNIAYEDGVHARLDVLQVATMVAEQDFLRQSTNELEERCHNPYSLVQVWTPVKKSR